MSRFHDYDDCYDQSAQWAQIRFQGALKKTISGSHGQAFLRELLTALDAMPEKQLIESELVTEEGCCALGVVFKSRGLDSTGIDPDAHEFVAQRLGITETLATQLAYVNDEYGRWRDVSPSQRFDLVREWVVKHIAEEPPDAD